MERDDFFRPGARVSFEMAVKERPFAPIKVYDLPAVVIARDGDQITVRYEWRGAEVLKVLHRRRLRIG